MCALEKAAPGSGWIVRASARWICLGLAALSAGCARSSAPHGWLPDPDSAPAEVHGGWIQLRDRAGHRHQGELVAVHDDSLFVLESEGLLSSALSYISEAEVWYFDPEIGVLVGAAVAGGLGTVSNGWFLVFTAPLWIGVGTTAAISESRAGRVRLDTTARPKRAYPTKNDPWSTTAPGDGSRIPEISRTGNWYELRAYARFPQGIPRSVDRTRLRGS